MNDYQKYKVCCKAKEKKEDEKDKKDGNKRKDQKDSNKRTNTNKSSKTNDKKQQQGDKAQKTRRKFYRLKHEDGSAAFGNQWLEEGQIEYPGA